VTDGDLLSQPQAVALIDELGSATELIDLGVKELHALSLANDFYHLPMQLLAQGLERFLKVTYALAHLGQTGMLPGRKKMRTQYGHKLVGITDDLVALAERSTGYVDRPAVREDLEFVRTDADLRQVLQILSEFGATSRYHRLDEFLDPQSVREDDPSQKWAAFEAEIIGRQPDWLEEIESGSAEKVHRTAVLYAAQLVDRFARAIARMWTLGALPNESRRYSPLTRPFLMLTDEQLGEPRT
jgi:hypothetical protein